MEKQILTEPEILLSDARGIYIPRDFAEILEGGKIEHTLSEEDLEILMDPEHDEYWTVWDEVLYSGRYSFKIIETDQEIEFYQEGDLWVLPAGFYNKVYRFESLEGGIELFPFFGDDRIDFVESLEELELYRDDFYSDDEYLQAVEYLGGGE